jgi:di/tricarboxylate transporter
MNPILGIMIHNNWRGIALGAVIAGLLFAAYWWSQRD